MPFGGAVMAASALPEYFAFSSSGLNTEWSVNIGRSSLDRRSFARRANSVL